MKLLAPDKRSFASEEISSVYMHQLRLHELANYLLPFICCLFSTHSSQFIITGLFVDLKKNEVTTHINMTYQCLLSYTVLSKGIIRAYIAIRTRFQ